MFSLSLLGSKSSNNSSESLSIYLLGISSSTPFIIALMLLICNNSVFISNISTTDKVLSAHLLIVYVFSLISISISDKIATCLAFFLTKSNILSKSSKSILSSFSCPGKNGFISFSFLLP